MNYKKLLFILVFIFFNHKAFGGEVLSPENRNKTKETANLEEIVAGLEKKYSVADFSADFFQKSTIKAMDITDTAFGKIFVKQPDMMRWEYENPEKQTIISDGTTLWVYRPEDNQVMTGKSPSFFGGGKGAGFLADMSSLKKQFIITLEKTDKMFYVLKLLPKEKTSDMASIFLWLSKSSFSVLRINTYNSYNDETIISLSNIKFNQELPDSMFKFFMPEGVDILSIDE